MNGLTFLFPAWFLLLPILWWLVHSFTRYFRRQSAWSKVCEPRLLPLLSSTVSKKTSGNQLTIILTILLSTGIIALAGPSWQKQDYPLLESAAARVLVLDLSQSMLVEDVKPNRLDMAVNIAGEIINSDFDGETALVVFAGAAFTVSPLTRDASTLLEFIDALSPDSMPLDGDRLDLALDKAVQLLTASITKTGQVYIITDGSSHFEQTVKIASEAGFAATYISALVIGSPQGGPMKNADGGLKRNSDGEFIFSKPNFEQLESITRAGRGRLIKLTDLSRSTDSLLRQTATSDLQLQDRDAESFRKPENGGFWLLWFMLPLALLLFRKNTIWIILIAVILPGERGLYAMEFNELWFNSEQRAFDAFQNGRYDEVQQLSKNPYLTGSALFRAQDYAGAIDYFSQQINAQSFYNRGNALAYQGNLDKALQAYRQALTLNPEFEDAIFNQNLIENYLTSTTASGADSSDEADNNPGPEDPQNENVGQSRQGQISEISDFRDQSNQAGIGASPTVNQTDLSEEENISEADIRLEQFLLRIQADSTIPDPESVNLWIESLYADPAELFKRKFLRDYLRDKQQER